MALPHGAPGTAWPETNTPIWKKKNGLFLTLRDVEEAQDCELQNLLEEWDENSFPTENMPSACPSAGQVSRRRLGRGFVALVNQRSISSNSRVAWHTLQSACGPSHTTKYEKINNKQRANAVSALAEVSSSPRRVCSLQHCPTKSQTGQCSPCTLPTALSFHPVCTGTNTCRCHTGPHLKWGITACGQPAQSGGKCGSFLPSPLNAGAGPTMQQLKMFSSRSYVQPAGVNHNVTLRYTSQNRPELRIGNERHDLTLSQEIAGLRRVFLWQSTCLHARWSHCPYVAAVAEVGMRQKGREWLVFFSICTSTAQES